MSDQDNWEKEKQSLLEEIEDMKVLYETVAEHSSFIENELEQKNQEISGLINQLKKYLSPQLYQSILGGGKEVSLNYERKFLSVFFSDIVNFTEISDRTDPEVLSEILNGYLNDMAQIAHKHGGTIDKFIGDALMVFFGDPEYINDEKHARDCCAMALEMQMKIADIDKVWRKRGISHGLQVRMGIHSGYCTVGNFGAENRMDYTIIGGNVNIASRLESLAEPSSTYISSVTANLLDDSFMHNFIQNITVKGIHYPIEVYKLTGKSSFDGNDDKDDESLFRWHEDGLHLTPFISAEDLQNEEKKAQLLRAIDALTQSIAASKIDEKS